MSIGNQEFGIPRKYQHQIGICYLCPQFLGIFLVLYRYLEYGLVKNWFNIGIFRKKKIGLVFGFRGCHFIDIGLVSVCHFPESGISTLVCMEYGVWYVVWSVNTFCAFMPIWIETTYMQHGLSIHTYFVFIFFQTT